MKFEQARVRALEGDHRIDSQVAQYLHGEQNIMHVHEPQRPNLPRSTVKEYASCCREVAQVLSLTTGTGLPDANRVFSLFALNAQIAPMGYTERTVFYRKAISTMSDDLRGIDGILDDKPTPTRTWGTPREIRLPKIPKEVLDQPIYTFSPDQHYIRARALAEMAALYFPPDKDDVVDRCMSILSGPTRGIQPWYYQYMADRLMSDGLRNAQQLTSYGVDERYKLLHEDPLAEQITNLIEGMQVTDESIVRLENAYHFGVGLAHYVISEAKYSAHKGTFSLVSQVPWCCAVPRDPLPFIDRAYRSSEGTDLTDFLDSTFYGLTRVCDPIVDYYSREMVAGEYHPGDEDKVLIDCHKNLANQGVLHAGMLHSPDFKSN